MMLFLMIYCRCDFNRSGWHRIILVWDAITRAGTLLSY